MRIAWKSALYNEAYNVCLQGAHGLSTQVDETISYVLENHAGPRGHSKVPSNVPDAPLAPSLLLDPHVSQTKGRKKGKEKIHSSAGRIKSDIELATEKNLRLCRCCNKMMKRATMKTWKKMLTSAIKSDEESDDEDMEEDVDFSSLKCSSSSILVLAFGSMYQQQGHTSGVSILYTSS
ncbi:hypothetical protein Dimus_011131 [Dionaea muscipula]